jgi:NADH-quinone oxidoreductase subunit N
VIFVTFGAITVVSARDLLTLFVGLELATIPLYFLVAWNKTDSKASEAATKYVLLGSTSTAVMLFGMSYLFGFAGSLRFDVIASAVALNPQSPLLWIAVLFLISGIGFKLTLFPFHTWAPDVYDGASTPVTAFLSVSSKATAISFLLVLLYGPLGSIQVQLQPLLVLLSAATMTIGNFGALKQRRLRRFMAWSSIAQAGYILAALTGPAGLAKSSVVFYLFVYAFSNYLVFFLISAVGDKREQTFAGLAGLTRQRPWLGAALAVGLFSLAGIPPVAGFVGKFMLFGSAANGGHFAFLAFVGVNTVIGLYCYLQMLKAGWVETPDDATAAANKAIDLSLTEKLSIIGLTLLVIFAGIVPLLSNNISAILQYGP